MNLLKQPTSKTCVHTVLAMIVGCPVQEVIDWFDNEGPLYATDMILFLAHHGILLAMYAGPADGQHFELSIDDAVDLKNPLRDRPAILTVQSERFEGKLHQVFWAGKVVHDPSPLVAEPRDIATYKIVEYWPLLITTPQAKRLGIEVTP